MIICLKQISVEGFLFNVNVVAFFFSKSLYGNDIELGKVPNKDLKFSKFLLWI